MTVQHWVDVWYCVSLLEFTAIMKNKTFYWHGINVSCPYGIWWDIDTTTGSLGTPKPVSISHKCKITSRDVSIIYRYFVWFIIIQCLGLVDWFCSSHGCSAYYVLIGVKSWLVLGEDKPREFPKHSWLVWCFSVFVLLPFSISFCHVLFTFDYRIYAWLFKQLLTLILSR